MLSKLWQDILYSLRIIRKNPIFSLVAVFTLAIGIAATTAVFSVVNAVLLRRLPYKNPNQLVMFWETNLKKGLDQFPASYPNFIDYKEQSRSFESLVAFRPQNFNLTGGGEPLRLEGAEVSEGFFNLLGQPPLSGRTLVSEDNQTGASVVVVSFGLWQNRFGSDPGLVGKALTLDGKPYTVVGIMPSSFRFPGELFERADLWVPLTVSPDEARNRLTHSLFVVGRLKPDIPIQKVQAEVGTVAKQLEQQYQDSNTGWGATVVTVQEQLTGDVRPSLLILFGAVSLVLLIACANIANLLLARSIIRQKEFAIRLSVGASRLRIIQQLLTESLVLALGGSILGLLLAFWGISLVKSLIPTSYNVQDIGLNAAVLFFSLLLAVITAILFGLAPAIQATKVDLNETLKEGSNKMSAGVHRRFLRQLLVVSEISLSIVLLIGAGLLIRSFSRLQEVDPGFKSDKLLTMSMTMPVTKYADAQKQRDFFQQILQQLRNVPGVKAVGGATRLPLSGKDKVRAFLIEGRAATPGEQLTASYSAVGADYFNTLGIKLIKGRYLTERDDDRAPQVVVINETLARRFFPGEEPLGKHLILKKSNPQIAPEIVGVIGDVRGNALDAESKAGIYVPYLQDPSPAISVALKTDGDPLGLAASARNAVRNVDKDQPIDNIATMEELVFKSTSQRRLNMVLLSVFAAIALVLAGVGIYSIMAQSVRQREHELGVRIALGAQPRHILKMVIGQGMILILIGIALGLVATFFLARLASSLLYGVSAVDPLIYGSVPLLLAAVALLASYIPARRATKVDPIIALRSE